MCKKNPDCDGEKGGLRPLVGEPAGMRCAQSPGGSGGRGSALNKTAPLRLDAHEALDWRMAEEEGEGEGEGRGTQPGSQGEGLRRRTRDTSVSEVRMYLLPA